MDKRPLPTKDEKVTKKQKTNSKDNNISFTNHVTKGRHAGVDTRFDKVFVKIERRDNEFRFRLDDGDNLSFWIEFDIPVGEFAKTPTCDGPASCSWCGCQFSCPMTPEEEEDDEK